MANEDIVFEARLEYRQMLRGLSEIGNAAGQAAASSDKELSKLGDALEKNIEGWRKQASVLTTNIEKIEATGQTGTNTYKSLIKDREKLNSKIQRTKELLDEELEAMARRGDPQTHKVPGGGEPKNVMIPGGGGSLSIGGQLGEGALVTRLDMSEFIDLGGAEADMQRLGEIIEQLFSRGEIEAKQFGAVFHTIATDLGKELKGEELSNALKPLEVQARNILNSFRAGDFDIAKDANAETLIAQMTELKAIASEFLQSSSKESQEFGANLLAKLDQTEDAYIRSGKSLDVLRKNMRGVTGEFKQSVGASDELKQELGAIGKLPLDLQKKFQAKLVEIEVKRLDNVIKKLGKSTSKEAQEAGEAFEGMGREIKDAYSEGDIGAKEAIDGLKSITAGANKAGEAFDRNFRTQFKNGMDNANVSVWKLGTAMDRVGVRGAGGILRVVDAVKGLGPAFIAAGVAAASLIFVVSKLASLAVELGKRLANAMKDFTLASIETAKQIQHIDAQFAGLLDGVQKLGTRLREYLLEQSFEFGVDLTGDFANILVPLTENTDQIRQLAKDLAAISHIRGIEMANLVNAVKQATGGHFRAFQQTLGFTPQEIDSVKEMQEEYGELAGTIMGLEDFMERRGIAFESIIDAMSVAQGQLNAFRLQLEIALGTPIRDAVGEQLHLIIDYIEDNRERILGFFRHLGEVISDVIGYLGDYVTGWLDDITPKDLSDLKTKFSEFGDSIKNLIDQIAGVNEGDFNPIVDGLSAIAEVGQTVADTLAEIAGLLDILTFVGGGFGISDWYEENRRKERDARIRELARNRDMSPETREAERLVIELEYRAETERVSMREVDLLEEAKENLEELRALDQEAREAGFNFAEAYALGVNEALSESRFLDWKPPRERTDEELREIDIKLETAESERKIKSLQDELKELYDQVGTKELKLRFDQREAQLLVDLADKELQIEVDFSIRRRDATNKYLDNIRETRISNEEEANEAVETFGEKEDDILQKYADKELDRAEDTAKNKIKIEEKYQEKIRDIRAKFDFDAAEAIRQNDAVALLRIRRREKFELAQAKIKYQDDIDANDEAAEEKRNDNKKWLERQIRDNKLAEKRKLEDLAQILEQKLQKLDRQYDDELQVLALHEQDKRDALETWRDQQDRDLDQWYENELERLDLQYADKLALIREKEAMLRAELIRQMELTARAVAPYYNQYMVALPNDPSLPNPFVQPFTYSVTPGGGVYGGYTAQPGSGGLTPVNPYFQQFDPAVTPVNPSTPGTTSQTNTDELNDAKILAVSLADAGGFWELAEMIERSTNLSYINQQLAWLRQQGLAGGGIAPAGRTSLVGERGPEPIVPASAGIVAPHVPFVVQPSVPGGGQVINDNSSNVSADLSMLDPSQLSPMQLTIIRSVVADEILRHGV